ncbi:proline-rich protein 36 isoform X2 [Stomoxys calcitrans]|uniref:Transcription cofactor vestigial-like protein 4 n=1 Tax=Stomoxys calcitrans TaxID=35570 RepID=A0A1I8Q4L4_STOCA|nr:proline-rich protein 36 isoform X2 [Stomoxys calcitrans]XP_013110972.1 proline-rich protein 36 isoform X2 [Stomoxys calcitrans]
MESALDVLSRAATMVQQDNGSPSWHREKRLRTGEYHHSSAHHHHSSSAGSSTSSVRAASPSSSPPPMAHGQVSPNAVNANSNQLHSNAHQISMMMAAAAAVGMRPLCETTNRHSPPPAPTSHNLNNMHALAGIVHSEGLQPVSGPEMDEAPLDMSVSSSQKQRNSPPPPYREPLPGSQFVPSLPRPSVITQAPPKRDIRDSALIANRENDNRSSESIDEHFRRSLGNDYFALFAKKSPTNQTTKTPSPQPQQPPTAHVRTPPPITGPPLHTPPPGQCTLVPPPPAYPNILPQAHQQQSHALMAARIKAVPEIVGHMCEPNSPPLPLVVRAPLQPQQQPLALQRTTSVTLQTPLQSPQSPTLKVVPAQSPISSTAGSRTASPLPPNNSQPTTAMSLSRFTSVENSPSSSPRHTPPVTNVAAPNASPTLPAIMRIKTEPGLQTIKAHNPTPPASPTSTTNPNILLTGNSNTAPSSPSPSSSSTATIKTNTSSTTTGGNSSAEVLASVDDHFAKALGDTWKRLQESKEMRK